MSNVWFAPLGEQQDATQVSEKVTALYNAANFEKIFSPNEYTAIKIHFGEKGD